MKVKVATFNNNFCEELACPRQLLRAVHFWTSNSVLDGCHICMAPNSRIMILILGLHNTSDG